MEEYSSRWHEWLAREQLMLGLGGHQRTLAFNLRKMVSDERSLSKGTTWSDGHIHKIILAELKTMFYDEYCENIFEERKPQGWQQNSAWSWEFLKSIFFKYSPGISLVAQWLRIRLPMQGTQVRALVWEDPTCRGATKPMHHNYWACVPQLLKPVHLEPELRSKRSHRNEKPAYCNKE